MRKLTKIIGGIDNMINDNKISIDESTDENNFTIKDTSSDIAPHLPGYMIEPLTVLARIKGFKGIDSYIIDILKNELFSIQAGCRGVVDIGEDVCQYLEDLKIFPPIGSEENENNDEEQEPNKKYTTELPNK